MTIDFSNIKDLYEMLTIFEMGAGWDHSISVKMFRSIKKYFENKYPKDDPRVREIFANMQGDSIIEVDNIRFLCHAEVEDAPHNNPVNYNHCQHCAYLDSLEVKWGNKCLVNQESTEKPIK